MVLRKVFGPKREEVRGEWRKLHNEELSDPVSFSRRTLLHGVSKYTI